MKNSANKSLRRKTLNYIGASILISVFLVSLFSSSMHVHNLRDKLERTLGNDVEKSALELNRIIESVTRNVPGLIGELSSLRPEQRELRLADYIARTTPRVLAIHVALKASSDRASGEYFSLVSGSDDPRLEGKSPETVRQKLRRIGQRELRKGKGPNQVDLSYKFESLLDEKDLRLGLINIVIRSGDKTSLGNFVVILTLWQSEFTQALGRNVDHQGFLLDKAGSLIATEFALQNDQTQWPNSPIVQLAKKSATKSGQLVNYLDAKGIRRSGAYYRLPQWGDLIVVNQQEVIAGFQQGLIFFTLVFGVGLALAVGFVLVAANFANDISGDLRDLDVLIKRIGSGDLTTIPLARGRGEIGQISHALNQMAAQIQSAIKSRVERAKTEKNLETSALVQSALVPKEDIDLQGLQISGFYQPSLECGGDIWGHITLRSGVELVYICDAMERGPTAATTAAVAFSSFRMVGNLIESGTLAGHSPARVLEQVNSFLFSAGKGQMCLTCFVAIFDMNTGFIEFANAGHVFPVLLPHKEDDQRFSRKKSRVLQKVSPIVPVNLIQRGMPIGLQRDCAYQDGKVKIYSGDKVMFFTDGLVDCVSPGKKRWGRKSLTLNLLRYANQNQRNLRDKIIERAFRFFGSIPIQDDITLVVVEVAMNWKATEKAGEIKEAQRPSDRRPADKPLLATDLPMPPPVSTETVLPPTQPITKILPVDLAPVQVEVKAESDEVEEAEVETPPELKADVQVETETENVQESLANFEGASLVADSESNAPQGSEDKDEGDDSPREMVNLPAAGILSSKGGRTISDSTSKSQKANNDQDSRKIAPRGILASNTAKTGDEHNTTLAKSAANGGHLANASEVLPQGGENAAANPSRPVSGPSGSRKKLSDVS